jgi:hypothetical protein
MRSSYATSESEAADARDDSEQVNHEKLHRMIAVQEQIEIELLGEIERLSSMIHQKHKLILQFEPIISTCVRHHCISESIKSDYIASLSSYMKQMPICDVPSFQLSAETMPHVIKTASDYGTSKTHKHISQKKTLILERRIDDLDCNKSSKTSDLFRSDAEDIFSLENEDTEDLKHSLHGNCVSGNCNTSAKIYLISIF